jgi:hypothetical protein
MAIGQNVGTWGSLGAARHVRLLVGARAVGDDPSQPGRGVGDATGMNLILLQLIGLFARSVGMLLPSAVSFASGLVLMHSA